MDKIFKILIVEDEETNFLYLKILLLYKLNLKCEIFYAGNGLEAVELFKNNTDLDIVFMDLKMPVMDGFEASIEIKKIRETVPIIALSAYSSPEDRQKAREAGCESFVSKPINNETFRAIVEKYLSI